MCLVNHPAGVRTGGRGYRCFDPAAGAFHHPAPALWSHYVDDFPWIFPKSLGCTTAVLISVLQVLGVPLLWNKLQVGDNVIYLVESQTSCILLSQYAGRLATENPLLNFPGFFCTPVGLRTQSFICSLGCSFGPQKCACTCDLFWPPCLARYTGQQRSCCD